MQLPLYLQEKVNKLYAELKSGELEKTQKHLTSKYKNETGESKSLISSKQDGLLYAISRMPATYAVIYTLISQIAEQGFISEIDSVLDVGAGTGAGYFAVKELDERVDVKLVEREEFMIDVCKTLAGEDVEILKRDIIRDELNENADLPDLILIDGGIGQVNAVQGILSTLDLDIPIIGLAEENEDIYLPGNSTPIQLPKRSDALRLLQRVRDETHRFATSKNQALRTKEKTANPFLELPHIGSKRAILLLKTYVTIQNLVDEVTKKGLSHLAETATLSPVQATETFQAAKILLSNQQ